MKEGEEGELGGVKEGEEGEESGEAIQTRGC